MDGASAVVSVCFGGRPCSGWEGGNFNGPDVTPETRPCLLWVITHPFLWSFVHSLWQRGHGGPHPHTAGSAPCWLCLDRTKPQTMNGITLITIRVLIFPPILRKRRKLLVAEIVLLSAVRQGEMRRQSNSRTDKDWQTPITRHNRAHTLQSKHTTEQTHTHTHTGTGTRKGKGGKD